MTTPTTPALSFERLVAVIGQVHADLAAQASRAVNASLTLRNRLIGFHSEEYGRRGVERQQYGEKLLEQLSESLHEKGVSRCDRRELYRYRQFYLTYPQIVETPSPQLSRILPVPADTGNNRESLTPKLDVAANEVLNKLANTHRPTAGSAQQRHFQPLVFLRRVTMRSRGPGLPSELTQKI